MVRKTPLKLKDLASMQPPVCAHCTAVRKLFREGIVRTDRIPIQPAKETSRFSLENCKFWNTNLLIYRACIQFAIKLERQKAKGLLH